MNVMIVGKWQPLILAALFCALTTQTQAQGCYEGASKVSDDCTLAWLEADPFGRSVVVGNTEPFITKFFRFNLLGIEAGFVADLTKIRVIPLVDVANKPGLRFEPIGDIWTLEADISGGFDDFVAASGSWEYIVESNSATPLEITGLSYNVEASGGFQAFDGQPCEFLPWPFADEGGETSGGVGVWTGVLFQNLLASGIWATPPEAIPGFPLKGTLTFAPQETISVRPGFEAMACDDTDTAFSQGAQTQSIELRTLLGGLPPVSAVPAGMVDDGTFEQCLEGWTLSGPGTGECVPVVNGTAAELTASDGTTSLSQLISTPLSSYMIFFDYQFETDAGELVIKINDVPVQTIPAQSSPVFEHIEILVNEPSLMGLVDAELSFALNSGSLADVIIGNIFSPLFNVGTDSFDKAETFACIVDPIFVSCYEPGVLVARDVFEDSSSALASASVGTLDQGTAATARAVSSVFGVEYGVKAQSSFSDSTVLFRTLATAESTARQPFISIGEDPFVPVEKDFVLSIDGTIILEGDLSSSSDVAPVSVGYIISIDYVNERAVRAHLYSGCFSINESGFSASCPNRDLFSSSLNFGDDLQPENITLIDETFDPATGKTRREYSISASKDVPAALHSEFGKLLDVRAQVALVVLSNSEFDGFVVADFFDSAVVTVSTSTPGVEVVWAGEEPPGENNPPVADAGQDQTVEAASSAGVSVMLDGSGSSDPDGDDLTYLWAGDFGISNELTPTVPLDLGQHTITLDVTDPGGLSDTDNVIVTIVDTIPPVVTAPPDLVVTATSPLTAVDLEASGPASADDIYDGPLTPTPDDPGPFAVGTHTVTWSATDSSGNVGSAAQTVEITEPLFDFVGFYQPAENPPTVNTVRAGQGIPMKWSIPDGQGGFVRDLNVVSAIQYELTDCAESVFVAENLVNTDEAGSSGLRYDAENEQFVYVWKPSKTLRNHCADFVLQLSDGSEHRAHFELK
jgi:hypothetical protein